MASRVPTVLLILVTALSVMLATSCGAGPGRIATVSVTDLLGRDVDVPTAVRRVVAIGPGALRLVVYASDVSQVVGIEQFDANDPTGRPYMLANPALAELPIIGQGGPNNAPDPERILTVAPDVIFSTYATEASVADELQAKTGIPVVVVSYGPQGYGVTPIFDEVVYDSLRLVGDITGQAEKAQAAIKVIQRAREDLEARTAGIPEADKPSVYVGGLGARGTHGIESTQARYALLDAIHARNVVDETDASGSVMIDREVLLAWDPDVIFIDRMGLTAVADDFAKNPTFYASLSAFRDGRVYGQLPYNNYNTNIDTAIADAYYLAKVLNPDAFADIEAEEKADEIYQALVGRPVYDQMADVYGGFGALALATP